MALTPSTPHILQFSFHSPSNSAHCFLFSELRSSHVLQSPPPWPQLQIALQRSRAALNPVVSTLRVKCLAKSTEEERWTGTETLTSSAGDVVDSDKSENHQNSVEDIGAQRTSTASYSDSLSLGIREPVYEVCAAVVSVCPK